MERLRGCQLRHCMELVAATQRAADRRALTDQVLDGLIDLVPGIQISYNEMSLARGHVAWVAKPVDIARFPGAEEIKGKYLGENPALRYCLDNPGSGTWVKVSDFMSRWEFHRTTIYQEFYRVIDTEHQIGVTISECGNVDVGFAINRDRCDFTEGERLVLNALAPHLRAAYENAAACEAVKQRAEWLERSVDAARLAIVEVTIDGRIVMGTNAAISRLDEYFEKRATGRVPDSLRRWLAHQSAMLRVRDDVPSIVEPLVREGNGARLIVRALRRDDGHVLLLLEEQRRECSLEPLVRRGLTGREAEVLRWVAAGKTNATIALILGISARTVDHHVARILQKFGVETRTAAVASAFESLSSELNGGQRPD